MNNVSFDTSVFISRSINPHQLPSTYLMPAVVIQELTAGAIDKSEIQLWQKVYKRHERDGTLLIPNGEDWWLAGKVLNSLLRGLKSNADGFTPRLSANEKQRIIRDVLIARVVKRASALLITNNIKDFQQIKRFCNLRFQSADQYFNRS